MRTLFLFFGLLCFLAPLIGIPVVAHYFNNAHLLLGLLFSYTGSIAALRKNLKFLMPTFLILCIEVWMSTGINLQLHLSFFLLCCIWGYIMAVLTNHYSFPGSNQTMASNQ